MPIRCEGLLSCLHDTDLPLKPNSPISVAADDLESIAGLVIRTDPKGHQGGAVHGVKVLATGLDLVGERLTLGQTGETGRFQATNHVFHGMVRIGAAGEEGACLLGKGYVVRVVRHRFCLHDMYNGEIRMKWPKAASKTKKSKK